MKANEFIKDKGIDKAKRHLELYGWRNTPFIIKLKRLIESHELVETEGGLLNVKNSLQMERDCGGVDMTPYGKKLYQAIADVESCYVD